MADRLSLTSRVAVVFASLAGVLLLLAGLYRYLDNATFNRWVMSIGAGFFGGVLGWMTHRVYRWAPASTVNVTWLAAILGVIGGGVITALFYKDSPETTPPPLFGAYSIGLGLSFFARGVIVDAQEDAASIKASSAEAATAGTSAGSPD